MYIFSARALASCRWHPLSSNVRRHNQTVSYFTALVIFAVCTLFALAVCAPVIYLTRRLRRRRNGSSGAPPRKAMSISQAIPGLILVVALFLAFAQQYISPVSWLGSRVSTDIGRFWLSVLVFLVFCVFNYFWFSFKARQRKTKPTDQH